MTLQRIANLNAEIEDAAAHPGRRLTESEFAAWCGPKTHAEWVDGEVILMAPASFEHVSLNDWLVAILVPFVRRHDLGVVLSREFQVRLAAQRRRRLPDVLFIAKGRSEIIQKTFVDGSPDLIMEVVSPESESRDWRQKYLEYERAGVREYWVIDPMSQHAEAYQLSDREYVPIAEVDGTLKSVVLPGFYLKVSWLWQNPLPDVLDVFRAMGVQ